MMGRSILEEWKLTREENTDYLDLVYLLLPVWLYKNDNWKPIVQKQLPE